MRITVADNFIIGYTVENKW